MTCSIARFIGIVSLLSLSTAIWVSSPVEAQPWVFQAPRGADFFSLPKNRMLCGQAPAGWQSDTDATRLHPTADALVGQPQIVSVAPKDSNCASASLEQATLIATGDHPTIDPSSVSLAIDAGRLELRGDDLEGIRVGFSADGKSGSDLCLDTTLDRGHEVCALNIDRSLPADPQRIELRWAPKGGLIGPEVSTFDKHGSLLAPDHSLLPIARILISRMFPDLRLIDVAHGESKFPLLHPEAVATSDCAPARCKSVPDGLSIGLVPAAASTVTARVKLLTRVFFARADVFTNDISETLNVVRCPMSIVSGEPLRNVDELKVLLRLDPTCVADVRRINWTANGDPSELLHVESLPDGMYVLLSVGRLSNARLSVIASRVEDGSALAVASEKSVSTPPLTAALILPGYGEIDFIPKNRSASVNVSHIAGKGELVPIAVPGAYTVEHGSDGGYMVRGSAVSGGYSALHFAYRIDGVPKVFADTDFGELVDTVQRPIREANMPAPIGASSITDHALVELFCRTADRKVTLIEPGTPIHIPFDERDSCRLVIHRERIAAEDGEQRLDVEVNVTGVSGADRPESHWTQHLVLHHAKDKDVVWIHGAKAQFDRIDVHITHVVDEWLYGGDAKKTLKLPSSQWSVVTEDAHLKFYATATIPGSLYRFSSDRQHLGDGPLDLNFGLLSRLTWLDSNGHEGLLAIEAGMLGLGLATDKDRQLAAVAGLGIAIPLANANQPTQAAVNVHAWMAYSFGQRHAFLLDDMGNATTQRVRLSNWAFVIGPSITVGSVGVLL